MFGMNDEANCPSCNWVTECGCITHTKKQDCLNSLTLWVYPLNEFHYPAPSLSTALLAYWLRCPPREQKILGMNPACAEIFLGSSHTSDLKIGTPVVTLPGACRYGVSTGTGWPGVSILWLSEMESFICNFCLSVAARKLVWADPSQRNTHVLLGC